MIIVLTVAVIAVVLLAVIITKAVTKRKIINKIDFMSDALGSGESAFRYSEDGHGNRQLNRSLNRLHSIFEAEKDDIRERDRYFAQMLDHVQSGVIVLDGDKVDYCNAVARGLLGMADISNLRQVERISTELAEAHVKCGRFGDSCGCPVRKRNGSTFSERMHLKATFG